MIVIPGGAIDLDGTGADNYVATFTGPTTIGGEANLTFDGNTLTVTGAVTVGVDDTGHNVTFFGATAGSYMFWDQANDRLILTDSTPIKIGDGGDLTLEHDGNSSISSTSGDFTISSGAKLNLTPTSDVHFANGTGVVIGHTAQITQPEAGEFQVLGTSSTDAQVVIGRWGDNANPPLVRFVKSRDGVIFDGSYATVADNDVLGRIEWYGDEGTDLSTLAAYLQAEVDDGSPEAGGIGTAFVFRQMPGGGTTAAAETMRISAAGYVGIGEASPDTMLHLKDGAPDITLEDSDGGDVYKIGNNGGNYRIRNVTDSRTDLNIDGAGEAAFTGNISAQSGRFVTSSTGTSAQLLLGASGTYNAVINSPESVYINIDSDNGQTDRQFTIAHNAAADGSTKLFSVNESAIATLFGTASSGSDTALIFDGEAQDYHIGLDDSGDTLVLGRGSTLGTTAAINIGTTGHVSIGRAGGTDSAASALNIQFPAESQAGSFDWTTHDHTGGAVTITGSATNVSTMTLYEPNITIDGGSVTNAATLRIATAPPDITGVGNEYALWVDAGKSRFDGTIETGSWIAGNTTNGYIRFYGDSGSSVLSQFTDTGQFMINETANAHQTIGLTINQGAADDQIISLKSSDIAHGMTDWAETDTFVRFAKQSATEGGLQIMAFRDAGTIGLELRGVGVSDNTTKSASGNATVQINAFKKTSATVTAVGSAGNLLAVKNNDNARLIVDAEGDLHIDNGGGHADPYVQVYDEHDDALLIRALDHAKSNAGASGLVKERWDDFVKYNEEDLIEHSILGDTIENGGFINVTGLQRLHNGAIWQGYTRQMEQEERIKELETRLLALEGGK